jgi:CrcB protein
MQLNDWLLLAVAGGAGSGLRALAVLWLTDRRAVQLWKTLMGINTFGSMAAGVLVARLAAGDGLQPVDIAVTGFLGGFTTFSGFAVEVVELWQRGMRRTSLRFAFGSVVLSGIAAHTGYFLAGGVS